MPAKLAQHPLMLAAMFVVAATGAMGLAAIPASQPTLAYEVTPQLVADDVVADDGIDQVLFKEAVATTKIDKQLECMAKVVLHEAANQSRSGQLAVAQLIMNRVGQDRFGETVCEVVNQPGQFFRTASYNPRRDTDRWATAVEVSRQAMAGNGDQVVPGAVFYHSAHQSPNRFFRTRERLTMVGDHVFYR
ncbi:cell wall hydrolase [Sphingomonas histidinilytica]|uniref:Cell Wall Hydrolase n=1 Tax=Rhizorhabdus histidinilytica TaxID=439228 RepID=A0A1T5FMD6_9SPHN|nr:cell wall hydrolase [Rhizorhabdus histidinilytica]MBO9380177.1 cell wall hydrolase [Rhizorhabdus histidinilytica]QEH79863.1 cell wall hydrolase [Sphingomonas sp. C8-2]SKB97276.1 Cell Wall Hydrolase [Rhizorhabdus histidinilytica]